MEEIKSNIHADIEYTNEQMVAYAALFELASMGLLSTTEEIAKVLVSGEYAEACNEMAIIAGIAEIDTTILSCYSKADAAKTFHELRRERTRLFVGERCPLITPYAGIRAAQKRGQRGQLMVDEESIAIERFMRRCGVVKDLSAGQANDPIDHFGTMCEFMQYLCMVVTHTIAPAEGAAVDDSDVPLFHAKHFAPYGTWCAERLSQEARTPYYIFLATLIDILANRFAPAAR